MATKNPLQHLSDFGQSVWNDNLSRELIKSGALQQLIDHDGIVGITSNPTIFDNAISNSNDYEDQMRELVREGRSPSEIQDALMIKDIQDACDILLPVYRRSEGLDGVVSLEVSPLLANDTEKTLSEARRLNKLVDRPNVMIKIPGTSDGVPAIEQALYEGININITLLFSLQAYRDVMDAYLSAMERRVAEEKPVHDILSVASFFVSRVDSEVDGRLESIIAEDRDSDRATTAQALIGQVAIANARLAYQEFKNVFNSARFSDLAGYGVRIQRPLWASTSTKNPEFPDTLYIDELVGPNTVQTLAPASIEAFRDHGKVAVTVEKDVDVAGDVIEAMESLGIRYDDVIEVLIAEGVEKFADSFHSLAETIKSETSRIAEEVYAAQRERLGVLGNALDTSMNQLEDTGAVSALRETRGEFWADDDATADEINGLLGWLHTVPEMRASAEAGLFASIAKDVRKRGYEQLVLLGMGGSSLAPEVMAATLSQRRGFPRLSVLDTTHPDSITRATMQMANERTLFVVSSKSGTTIETSTLFEYFLDQNHGNADDFIVITDPGTPLEARARNLGVWKVFTNRHDIGGRFSALSLFGLVPAAAAGINVTELLDDAAGVLPVHNVRHPGIILGASLAAAYEAGRNKLTLLSSDCWSSFGDWLEQLVAESTGKHDRGIVPVVRELARSPSDYGNDRVFVLIDDGDSAGIELAKSLCDAGHPVCVLPARLGQLFMTWEIATAIIGHQLGLNPFDQPNVQEAKDQTNKVLESSSPTDITVTPADEAVDFAKNNARSDDYIAIQAFVDPTPEMIASLAALRSEISSEVRAPVTVGIGPRFLHSTGQLHKGGPNQGLFVQVVQQPTTEIDVPGRGISFGDLFAAQADGDFLALTGRDLRIVRVTINSPDELNDLASVNRRTGVSAD